MPCVTTWKVTKNDGGEATSPVPLGSVQRSWGSQGTEIFIWAPQGLGWKGIVLWKDCYNFICQLYFNKAEIKKKTTGRKGIVLTKDFKFNCAFVISIKFIVFIHDSYWLLKSVSSEEHVWTTGKITKKKKKTHPDYCMYIGNIHNHFLFFNTSESMVYQDFYYGTLES